MNNAAPAISKIEEFLQNYIEQFEGVFLIEVKSTPGNKITALLDADQGLTIETCSVINRALYKFIEAEGFFPDGNFSLEVSSPGVDKPLKLQRQYIKNKGRKLEVTLTDGTKLEGSLTEVDDSGIVIIEQHGKGKHAETKITKILFENIKQSIVLITF